MKLIIDYAKTTTTTTTLILSFGKHLKLKLKKKENSIFSSFFSFFNDYFSIIITPVTIYITGIMMMMIIFFGRWIIEKQNKTKQENIEMDCFVLFCFVCQYSIWKWKKEDNPNICTEYIDNKEYGVYILFEQAHLQMMKTKNSKSKRKHKIEMS